MQPGKPIIFNTAGNKVGLTACPNHWSNIYHSKQDHDVSGKVFPPWSKEGLTWAYKKGNLQVYAAIMLEVCFN